MSSYQEETPYGPVPLNPRPPYRFALIAFHHRLDVSYHKNRQQAEQALDRLEGVFWSSIARLKEPPAEPEPEPPAPPPPPPRNTYRPWYRPTPPVEHGELPPRPLELPAPQPPRVALFSIHEPDGQSWWSLAEAEAPATSRSFLFVVAGPFAAIPAPADPTVPLITRLDVAARVGRGRLLRDDWERGLVMTVQTARARNLLLLQR